MRQALARLLGLRSNHTLHRAHFVQRPYAPSKPQETVPALARGPRNISAATFGIGTPQFSVFTSTGGSSAPAADQAGHLGKRPSFHVAKSRNARLRAVTAY